MSIENPPLQLNDLLSQLEPYWLLELQQVSIVRNDEAAFIQLRRAKREFQIGSCIPSALVVEVATLTGQRRP